MKYCHDFNKTTTVVNTDRKIRLGRGYFRNMSPETNFKIYTTTKI